MSEKAQIEEKSLTTQPESRPSQPLWWPELDGLRSLAFILVYYHHTVGLFWRNNPGNSSLYKYLFYADQRIHNWGWVGVDLFFVLSAFLITSLLLRERASKAGTISLKNFFARRVLRIWPLYFCYLTVVAILSLFLSPAYSGVSLVDLSSSAGPSAQDSWKQLLCFALFVGNFAVIGQGVLLHLLNPMWSLCIEEQFYIIWGLSMKVLKKNICLLVLLIVMGLAAPALRYYLWSHDTKNYLAYYLNSLSHCDAIVGGGIAAFVWARFGHILQSSICLQVLMAAAAFICLAPLAHVPYIEESDVSIVWVMSSIALGFVAVLLTTLSNDFVRRFFAQPWLTHIGRLTYGLYIFHFLVIYSLVYICRIEFQVSSRLTYILISWPLGLALTYMLARFSWRFIEAPALAMKERYRA